MTISSSSSSALASEHGSESVEDTALATEDTAGSARLRSELNVFDAVAVVVGTVIGSGIFILPSFVAAQLHSLGPVLLVWLVGGLLSAFGALSLAELGSIYPGTGGLCTYLRNIYGPLPAFLYAWALLLMIHTGSIAALAVAFGIFAGQVLSLNVVEQKLLSAGLILGLTVVSCLGIRDGKFVQNLVVLAKVGGLAGIILLLSTKGSLPLRFFNGPTSDRGAAFSLAGCGIALVAVLWAYEGWHVLSFIAGEMKKPKVDLPRGLLYGSAIVMLIYLAANLGYYHVLPAAEIQGSNAVAAMAVGKLLGRPGANAISILIVISILGSMNGLILSGPRVSFAMAREGIFPAVFGRLNHRYRTPVVALLVQGIWAAMLAVSGNYQQLFTDVIFAAWIFYGLAVAGVLVLRRSQPELERPFAVPGYPWLSLMFCAAAGLIINTIIARPLGAAIGLGLVATGVPVYFFAMKLDR